MSGTRTGNVPKQTLSRHSDLLTGVAPYASPARRRHLAGPRGQRVLALPTKRGNEEISIFPHPPGKKEDADSFFSLAQRLLRPRLQMRTLTREGRALPRAPHERKTIAVKLPGVVRPQTDKAPKRTRRGGGGRRGGGEGEGERERGETAGRTPAEQMTTRACVDHPSEHCRRRYSHRNPHEP